MPPTSRAENRCSFAWDKDRSLFQQGHHSKRLGFLLYRVILAAARCVPVCTRLSRMFSLSPTGGKAQSKTPGQAAAARGVFLTKTSRNVQRQKPSSRAAVSACTCRLCLRTAFLLSSHCPQSAVLQNDALSVLLLPAYICRGNKLLLLAFARLLRHLYMSVTSL